MRLIDSHCHLNSDYSPKSLGDIVSEARSAGVSPLITIGTELKTITEIQAISEQFEDVFHTVGVHPHDSSELQLGPEGLGQIEKASAHPKCRAIGEIGLDYHYDHSPREIQRKWLDAQLEIAARRQLPVVIHSREGEEDLLASLRVHTGRLPKDVIPGVIHCFSGTQEFGQECLELGFYISFSGILTFKKAESVRECARIFPLDRILVETDAPFLAPLPYRGKKCEPSMVRLTAQKLAEVKGLPLEEIARATTANSRKVFRLPDSPSPA